MKSLSKTLESVFRAWAMAYWPCFADGAYVSEDGSLDPHEGSPWVRLSRRRSRGAAPDAGQKDLLQGEGPSAQDGGSASELADIVPGATGADDLIKVFGNLLLVGPSVGHLQAVLDITPPKRLLRGSAWLKMGMITVFHAWSSRNEALPSDRAACAVEDPWT